MPMLKIIKRVIFLMLLTATFAHSASKDEVDWTNVEVVIRGDYFRAASVAYADYSKRLADRVRKSTAADSKGDQKLAEYLSTIEHFNIQVGYGNDRYRVWILARASKDFPVIFGGDAVYFIDDKNFTILEKRFGK
jgi:hypothetical protein